MIRAAVVFLFASACCTSLPDAAPKNHGARVHSPAPFGVDAEQHVWRDERRGRDVPVKIYMPREPGDPSQLRMTRRHAVIFSHGIGEDRDSYEYLGQALAEAGFVAVHITHAGTDRAMLERGYRHLYRATKERINWVNRPLDVSFVIDQLPHVSRIAVAGHSAGAFTAFAVAGMRLAGGESFRDERVHAIVPMSMPRMDGILAADGFANIGVPVLNMTGTCDTSLIYRTWPKHRRIPFQSSPGGPHYLITMEDVNHSTFSNRRDERHALIAELTVLFVRAFLLDEPDARAWFNDPGRGTIGRTELTLERK
ncbi:MAG TPA: hypothetical protein VMS98_02725 [Thermoanaerobaculia bacterium]|nr:hypothetical protein [Thermoanaerobaculia bacterium]